MEEAKKSLTPGDLQDIVDYMQSMVKMTQIQAKSSKDHHSLVFSKVQDLFLMIRDTLGTTIFNQLASPLVEKVSDFNP